MTALDQSRGGAPVGYLAELAPLEAHAVHYLRLWCDGSESRAQVHRDFVSVLGAKGGQQGVSCLQALYDSFVRHGRRPLMRHHPACACLGADESCFATFVGYASEGAREDALMIATTLVRPDVAPSLVHQAQHFGLALRRMTLKIERLKCGSARTVH